MAYEMGKDGLNFLDFRFYGIDFCKSVSITNIAIRILKIAEYHLNQTHFGTQKNVKQGTS